MSLFPRALLALLLLPGVVAILVPAAWLWTRPVAKLSHPAGLCLIAIGLGVLLWCVGAFYAHGRGTLAPWAPPVRLVAIGPYRYTRNPMYVAVTVTLFGWAASFGSVDLLAYSLAVLGAFHLRVVLAEEPFLARSYGAEWTEYAKRVPRWLW
jgi:protein-S-isoprenylcysteine O-methyltransferase Ste14